jgi:hypothetical protein
MVNKSLKRKEESHVDFYVCNVYFSITEISDNDGGFLRT